MIEPPPEQSLKTAVFLIIAVQIENRDRRTSVDRQHQSNRGRAAPEVRTVARVGSYWLPGQWWLD